MKLPEMFDRVIYGDQTLRVVMNSSHVWVALIDMDGEESAVIGFSVGAWDNVMLNWERAISKKDHETMHEAWRDKFYRDPSREVFLTPDQVLFFACDDGAIVESIIVSIGQMTEIHFGWERELREQVRGLMDAH